MSSKTIFLVGASGNIGSYLAPLLLKDPSNKLILPTTSAAKLTKTYGSNASVIIEEGSITNSLWVGEMLKKHAVTHVFLNVVSPADHFITTNFLEQTYRLKGQVKHLVYLSALDNLLDGPGGVEAYLKDNLWLIVTRVLIEQILRAKKDELPYTVLGPSSFFSNDRRGEQMVMGMGFYPEPKGTVGTSRVFEGDIALAAANAMKDVAKWNGKKIMIGSLHGYTDEETAKLFSDALGKKISSPPSTQEALDGVEQFLTKDMGPEMAGALARMYAVFMKRGWLMTEADYKLQVELLGQEPASYEKHVVELTNEWKKNAQKA